MFLDLELLEKKILHLNWLTQSMMTLINGPQCKKKPKGWDGYSQCFFIRVFGLSIFCSPPKTIRNIRHFQKIFEILAPPPQKKQQQTIPILYLDLKKIP